MKFKLLVCFLLLTTVSYAQLLTNYAGKIISSDGNLISQRHEIRLYSVQSSVIDQVVLLLRIDDEKNIYIDWGDGTQTTATGNGTGIISYNSNYTINSKTYNIIIWGDLDNVKVFSINESTIRWYNINQLSYLTTVSRISIAATKFSSLNINNLNSDLTDLVLSGNTNTSITGSIESFANIDTFFINSTNSVSGSITNLINLSYFYYSGSAITGDISNLISLRNINYASAPAFLLGSITNMTYLSNLTVGGFNVLSGNVTNLTNLTVFYAGGNNTIGGYIDNLTNITQLVNTSSSNTMSMSSSVSSLTKLTQFYVVGSNFTGTLDCSNMTNLTYIIITNNSLLTYFIAPTSSANLNTTHLYSSGYDKFDFTNTTNIGGDLRIYSNANDTSLRLPVLNRPFTIIYAQGNALNTSSIDQLLSRLNDYYSVNPPTSGLSVNISGGTNSAPTGGDANPDLVNLGIIFANAGKSLSIVKN